MNLTPINSMQVEQGHALISGLHMESLALRQALQESQQRAAQLEARVKELEAELEEVESEGLQKASLLALEETEKVKEAI